MSLTIKHGVMWHHTDEWKLGMYNTIIANGLQK